MKAGSAGNQASDDVDEVKELETKLEALKLPEETRSISKKELRKLRQLGPRN